MADEKSTEIVKSGMNKTEARELKSVVKAEMKFLRDEMGGKVAEVKQEIRHTLDEESEAMLKTARSRVEKLRKKGEKILEEGRQMLEEFRGEGIDLRGSYNRSELFSYSVSDDLKVVSQTKRMEKAMAQVDSQQAEVQRGLTIQENKINRELVGKMMSTSEGQAYLDNIPTLESLIDAPNLKQILA